MICSKNMFLPPRLYMYLCVSGGKIFHFAADILAFTKAKPLKMVWKFWTSMATLARNCLIMTYICVSYDTRKRYHMTFLIIFHKDLPSSYMPFSRHLLCLIFTVFWWFLCWIACDYIVAPHTLDVKVLSVLICISTNTFKC